MEFQTIQTPLIFGCLFVVASVVLFFVYKFGIKEKSYEEALAEQRQQTHALLGFKQPKQKDKKNKKAAKKVKEKPNIENDANEQQDEPEQSGISETTEQHHQHSHKKHHVEFKEETEEVPIKDVITPPKKRTKKEKVRPILITKDNPIENINLAVDDNIPPANINHFEELHPKDEFELLRSNSTDELLKNEKDGKGSKKHHTTTPVEPEYVKTTIKKVNNNPPETLPQPLEKGKEEKRNESQNVPLVTNGLVANAGKEKKKKKSEFNTLQQLSAGDGVGANMSFLLNLVRKAELSRSEVQILIDLLLNKQHEAPAIVDEWSEGKSDPVQKLKKQLAEKEKLLAEEQEALLGAQAKLREVRAEQQADRSQLQQKIRGLDELLQNKQVEVQRFHQQLQQLQGQLKEEMMKSHKLREDLGAMQMQRQQFEMRIAQAQEADVIIAQLQNDNQQLRLELTRLSEENVAEKDTNQAYIVRLTNFQKELELKTDHIRKIEENRVEMEHKLEKLLRQENDYKVEISRLNTACQQQLEEFRRLELGKKQYQDEVYRLQNEKDEADRIIAQYKTELQQIIEEKSQLQAATQANGAVEEKENKAREVELLNLHNELASIKSQLQQTGKNYENDLLVMNATIEKLQEELNEQKEKNNKIKATQETTQIEFIQRLFPEIKELEDISPEVFQTESEKHIRQYIENLQKQQQQESTDQNSSEVKKLESQILSYQNSIDNAEKILVNLQKHVEQEELNWRAKLDAKTKEVESLKASISTSTQLKEKLSRLEKELEEERENRNRVVEELEQFKSNKSKQNPASDSTIIIERLSQEVDRLREQLQEQNKNGDINSKQNCNATNGPALLDFYNSATSSTASSLNEFSVKKSKSKKKKKKESTN